jgi:hypothetical protein
MRDHTDALPRVGPEHRIDKNLGASTRNGQYSVNGILPHRERAPVCADRGFAKDNSIGPRKRPRVLKTT